MECKVKFIVTGGQAVLFYGVHRNTGDLDILIEPTAENGARLILALKKMNLKLPELRPEEFENELVLAFGFEPEAVDIMNKTAGIEFESAYKNAKTVSVEDVRVKVIDIADLIRNKELLNREGEKKYLDKFDAESLKKIQRKKKR